MKKILVSIVTALLSVYSYAQNTDTLYVRDLTLNQMMQVNTYVHYNKYCPKIYGKKIRVETRQFVEKYHLLPCNTCYNTDKDFSNIAHQEKTGSVANCENELIISGKYLKKSANFNIASISMGATAAIGAAVMATQDTKKELYIIPAVVGVGALICECLAISYKWKSGNNLILAGSKIQYNF